MDLRTAFRDPTDGFLVTQGWGYPRTYRGPDAWHEGLDFSTPIGTPIRAIADGVVERSVDLTGSDPAGQMLVLDHGGVKSRYLHLDRRVSPQGSRVAQGQIIGYSGNSGIKSSAPHLHFDMRVDGAHLLQYVRVFGNPTPAPPRKSDGLYSVPAEPLIPAMYSPGVLTNAKKRNVGTYSSVAATAAALGGILLFGLVGFYLWRQRR